MENKNSKIGRKTDALGNIKSSKNTDERTKNLLNFGFIVVIGIIFVGLTLGCIGEKKPEEEPEPEPPTLNDYLNEAKTLKEKGDIDAALNVLLEANKLHPKTPDVLLEIAKIYKENKTYAKAEEYFERTKDAAEEKTPGDTTIHYEVVKHQKDIAKDTGDYDPVINTYIEITKTTPDDASAHKGLGDTIIETGDTSDALDEFTIAKKFDPTILPVSEGVNYNNLAIIEADTENYEKAEDLFEISLLYDLGNEKTLTNYATMEANWAFDKGQKGDIISMADLATESIKIKPTSNGYYILGIANAMLENESEAVNNLNDALDIDPDCYKCENALGVTDARNENFDSAKIHFENAIKIESDYKVAQDNLDITNQILRGELTDIDLKTTFNFGVGVSTTEELIPKELLPPIEEDMITCAIEKINYEKEEISFTVNYEFEKKGLQNLSQKHKKEWGDKWCLPTSAGISLGWFAEHGGFPKLVPDTNKNGKVDEKEKYELIDTLGKDFFHVTAEGGSANEAIFSGFLKYLKSKGLLKNFTITIYYPKEAKKELEETVKKYENPNKLDETKKKVEEIDKKVKEVREQIENLKREINERDAKIKKLTAEKNGKKVDTEEWKKLNKQIDDLWDEVDDLWNKLDLREKELARLLGAKSVWESFIDIVENWDKIKNSFKDPPTLSDFCAELTNGEDVLLQIGKSGSSHAIVGAACSKNPNKDGTYNVSFVDPEKGKTIHTKMRKQGGKWQVNHNGVWRDMLSMVAVSPIKGK